MTVVVACFNHACYVEQALRSVFAQNYSNLRVIVTDDASSDDSQEVIDRVLGTRGWTAQRIFHEHNRGICATFNEALAMVETPFVAFLAADDWCEPTRIARQVSAMEARPAAALSYGPVTVVSSTGGRLGRSDELWYSGDWPGTRAEIPSRSLLVENWIPAPSVLCRTAALRSVGGYDETLPYEDWDMWLRLAAEHEFVHVPEPLVNYRIHDDNATGRLIHADPGKRWSATVAILEKHLGRDDATDSQIARLLHHHSAVLYDAGLQRDGVRRHFIRHARRNRSPAGLAYLLDSLIPVPVLGFARGVLRRFPPRRTERREHAQRCIRVVILDHTGALGGAELALARLLPQVDPSRFDVRVLLFADGPFADRLRETAQSVEVVPLSPAVASTGRQAAGRSVSAIVVNILRTIPHALSVTRRVGALSPDVLHSTSLKSDLIAVPVSWLSRTPLVWHVHDRISEDYLPHRAVKAIRFLARRTPRHVVVNSEATAATLPGVRNMTVAYPGFTPDQVGAAPSSRVPPDPPVVGILGRISPTKGQLVLVRAAAHVLRQNPRVRFRIIGDALFGEEEYAGAVRREVDALGIASSVEFVGFVSNPESALDALTLCVHASPTPEPFGQVIVEAMIRGVPVVATEGGGVTEILRAGPEELGWLVPPGDEVALAHAITEAINDPDEAARRAQRAWDSAQARFPIERTADAVTATWLLAARRRLPAASNRVRSRAMSFHSTPADKPAHDHGSRA